MKAMHLRPLFILLIGFSSASFVGAQTKKDWRKDLTDYAPEKDVKIVEQVKRRDGLAVPTRQQLAFMDRELGMFMHFGGAEVGKGPPASAFNPSDLDCEQWVKVAKSLGANYMVLTTRHEDGFCLWPSKTTEYCVRNSRWKDGKGDVIRQYVDACRKHGMRVGFYHSSSFDQNNPDWKDFLADLDDEKMAAEHLEKDPVLETYTRQQEEQLRELFGNYGPIDYVWFDHHAASPFWKRIDIVVRELQPACLIFGKDVWINGGHSGNAGYPLWYAQNTSDGTDSSRPTTKNGEPMGQYFRVWETNTTCNGRWYGGGSPISVEGFMNKYYSSIGRGANFLPNFAPVRATGLMADDVVRRAKEIGDEIRRRFSTPIAQTSGAGNTVTLNLDEPATIDHVIIMEELVNGQKIAQYVIEAKVRGGWRAIAEGQTVGHKKIDRIDPITTDAVRFRSVKSVAEPVEIRSLSVYGVGK